MTDKVQELGKLTADEIAGLLKEQGIKGWRNDPDDCPLAVYSGFTITRRCYMDEEENEYPAPRSVLEFINKFDDNQYPELISDFDDES